MLKLGKIRENNHRSLASEWGNSQNDQHEFETKSVWTTITSFSKKNKRFRPSSKNALIKRNLEILEKINKPSLGFLRRKRKENGIYSEIRSHISKMSQFTKESKHSSKTYTSKLLVNFL